MAGHYIETAVDNARFRLLNATTTLCLQKREVNGIEPAGSGVLIRANNDIFLVTAAHLLNDQTWPFLSIPGDSDTMINLQGELCTTYLTSNTKSKIDFSILRFYPRMHKYLNKYSPINVDEILMNHRQIEKDQYIVAGYPIRKVKKESVKRKYTAEPFSLLTHSISKKRYQKHDFEPNIFTLVAYQKRLQKFGSNQIHTSGNPQGISGGGLFFIPEFSQSQIDNPRHMLVGIMIENHQDKGFMMAIRIDIIVEVMRKEWNLTLPLPFASAMENIGKIYKGDYDERVKLSEEAKADAKGEY